MSQAGVLNRNNITPGSGVQTIEGNTGGPISPNLDNNIFVVGDGSVITVTGTPFDNTLTITAAATTNSFPTDSGTATPSAGVLNIKTGLSTLNAGSSVDFTGSGNTVLFNVTDSNSNTIIGSGSGNLTISGTKNSILGKSSGHALTSGANNTIIGEAAGSSLTSGGTNIIIGQGSGSNLTSSESTNLLLAHAGVTGTSGLVAMTVNGNLFMSNFPGSAAVNGRNIFLGELSGNLTVSGIANTGIGEISLGSLTTGVQNTALGSGSGYKVTTGSQNVIIGRNSAYDTVANTGLVTGSYNIIIGGYEAAYNYTSSESDNIIIGNRGVLGESNVMRLGTTGSGSEEVNKTFVAGIRGATSSTADQVMIIDSTDNVVPIAAGTSGYVLTSAGSGANPTWSPTSPTFFWNFVTTSTQSMVANNGYVQNHSGQITFTLPSTAAAGTILRVKGYNTGGWTIVLNNDQYIIWDAAYTTTITTGSLTSTDDNDAVEMICLVANTAWGILSSMGNITVA